MSIAFSMAGLIMLAISIGCFIALYVFYKIKK